MSVTPNLHRKRVIKVSSNIYEYQHHCNMSIRLSRAATAQKPRVKHKRRPEKVNQCIEKLRLRPS